MDDPTVNGVAKLAEVVFSGFGVTRFFEPWLKVRLAKATAEQMRILAHAEIDVRKIRAEGEIEVKQLEAQLARSLAEPAEFGPIDDQPDATPLLLSRVKEQVTYRAAKQLLNVEQIAAEAAAELEDKEASPDPLDEDWVARFFASAAEVSSQQMQRLWGKILAGEVAQPGRYSLRCLDVVRNLAAHEAQLFEQMCPFVLNRRLILSDRGPLFSERQHWFEAFQALVDAGLFSATPIIQQVRLSRGGTLRWFTNDIGLAATANDEVIFDFPAYGLTVAGIQLSTLLSKPSDHAYLRAIRDTLVGLKCDVTAHRVSIDNSTVTFLDECDL